MKSLFHFLSRDRSTSRWIEGMGRIYKYFVKIYLTEKLNRCFLFYRLMELTEFVDSLALGKIKRLERYPSGQHNDTYFIATEKDNFSLRYFSSWYKK